MVGGHTNTFLYNGIKPSKEKIVGKYPTEIKQTSGKIVPVVQAYAYNKYLGHLVLTFDENGNLNRSRGNPILLTQDLPQGELLTLTCVTAFILILCSSKIILDIQFNSSFSQKVMNFK